MASIKFSKFVLAGVLCLAVLGGASWAFAEGETDPEAVAVTQKPLVKDYPDFKKRHVAKKNIPESVSEEEAHPAPKDELNKVPDIVLAGLTAYQSQGAQVAIRIWTKGGPIEGNEDTLKSVEVFNQVQAVYGKYVGYELVKTQSINSTSKMVYLQMNYEKGPLFGKFLCYWTGNAWILTGRFVFNTDPKQVLDS